MGWQLISEYHGAGRQEYAITVTPDAQDAQEIVTGLRVLDDRIEITVRQYNNKVTVNWPAYGEREHEFAALFFVTLREALLLASQLKLGWEPQRGVGLVRKE